MAASDTSENANRVTPELLATYSRPTDVSMAPDGSRIAYVVAPMSKDVDKDNEHRVSTIWVAGAIEGEPRQFTSGIWEDAEPRWSPDGSQIAFFSDRAERGKQSLYIMPSDGGEGIRVFDQQGDLSDLRWSPDGRYLSFLFTDPETDEEKEKKENKDDVKVWDANPKWRRLWLIDRERDNAASTVSPDARHVWSHSWSPDSSHIAVNSSPNPRLNDVFLETRVDLIQPDGSDPSEMFSLTGTTGNLVWSPDSERIAYVGSAGQTVNGEHLFVVNVSDGTVADLTPDLAGTIENIVPIRDGAEILARISYGVNESYRRVSWDGMIEQTLRDGDPWGAFHSPPAPAADGSLIAGIWGDGTMLPEVWVLESESQQVHRRTNFSAVLDGIDFGNQQIVCWQSDPDVSVEAIMITPPDYDESKRYPLVVQIHGGPTGKWANEWYGSWHDWGQLLASRGFVVLMHNPRGSTGYGSEFMNALVDEVGRVELRDLMAGVDALIDRGIADPERLGVGGWSWGGYMTSWTVTQTNRFKAAVMGAGLPNMVSDNSIGDIPAANLSYFSDPPYENPDALWERSAVRHIRDCTTPVLILHGEADERVNMFQSVEMYVALRELGKAHEFVTYPREPHGITERKHQIDLMERVVRWYTDHLND